SMRALVKAYRKANNVEKNAVYVFLVNLPCSDSRLQGFMPFNKQFGFVFVQATGSATTTLTRTIAHEVAHGLFTLRHTFSNENTYILPQGTTDNLMDYSGQEATALYKYQWDLIHNPQRVWFAWLEDEEEGATQLTQDPICVQKFLEQYRYAFVKKQKLIYPKDGYPYFGHYANNIKLLDGNTYKKIHISIYQNIGAVPLKLISQYQAGTYCY
ncbi:MAG: hypothetical protein WHT29_12610, partial [Bacteroidales bacterium]